MILKRLVEKGRCKSKRTSPEQTQLPIGIDLRLNQIPDDWHQIAMSFRRVNGIRDSDSDSERGI
jgi:hypothetical protein